MKRLEEEKLKDEIHSLKEENRQLNVQVSLLEENRKIRQEIMGELDPLFIKVRDMEASMAAIHVFTFRKEFDESLRKVFREECERAVPRLKNLGNEWNVKAILASEASDGEKKGVSDAP